MSILLWQPGFGFTSGFKDPRNHMWLPYLMVVKLKDNLNLATESKPTWKIRSVQLYAWWWRHWCQSATLKNLRLQLKTNRWHRGWLYQVHASHSSSPPTVFLNHPAGWRASTDTLMLMLWLLAAGCMVDFFKDSILCFRRGNCRSRRDKSWQIS